LGEQKLNDFSVREAKIGEKQSRQSTSKYSFMQQAVYNVNGVMGSGESPRPEQSHWSWEIFQNFCVKSNL